LTSSIDAMHVQLRPLFRRFVAECSAKFPVRVIMTLRTPAEQDALYAMGRTAPGRVVTQARGYQSYHVWGVAADIAPERVLTDRNWMPAAPEWAEMERIALALGMEHDVKGDLPHFSYKEGGHWRRWYAAFPSLPPDHFTKIV
jgi:peptidoglycan L-alanyl-D-glutamate endopeptidase CwlK